MNPFVSRITNSQNWVIPVSVLSLVLGFMITMARVTGDESRRARLALSDPQLRDRVLSGPLDVQKQVKDLVSEVNKLRSEKTTLENAVAAASDQTKTAKLLNESLQETKVVADLTPVVGPGITVTLRDSRPSGGNNPEPDGQGQSGLLADEAIIHDRDVLGVVNELYASGAEAISINNIRLGSTSSVRCVGPTVLIDGVRVASPVRIRAIGDPETLEGGLIMPGGIFEELRSVDPRMVEIEKNETVTMPAYTGSTTRRYAKVPQESQ